MSNIRRYSVIAFTTLISILLCIVRVSAEDGSGNFSYKCSKSDSYYEFSKTVSYDDLINQLLEQSQKDEDLVVEAEVSEPVAQPSKYIELSESEIYELATLVYLEAGSESYECQQAVASVVINRMTTSGGTLHDVIYAKNQFSPAHLIDSSSPTQSTLDAVNSIVENGPTLPEYVTYFRAGYYFNWGSRYVDYTCIDNTYFTYDSELKATIES